MSFFRRIIGKVFNTIPAVTTSATTTSAVTSLSSIAPAPSSLSSPSSIKITQAHTQLRDSIRELSKGISQPIAQAPQHVISELRSKKLTDLTTEQLEQLARVYYEGSSDNGKTLGKNVSKAVEIWKECSKNGSIEGTYSYASCLRDGVGIEKDVIKALDLFVKLADDKDYHLAHYTAGMMLLKGEEGNITIDESRAVTHLKAAAKGGVLPALHNIANCYAYGKGVKKSDYNAKLYYEAASEAGDPFSKYSLGTWYYTGRGGVKDRAKAFKLQLEAANMDHPIAMFNVASHYMSGEGLDKKDHAEAIKWFEKSANKGIVQARINWGNMYIQGVGVEKDNMKAKEIFKVGVDAGNAVCTKLYNEL